MAANAGVELDPAFADARGEIAGATYTAEDESGDALKFTQNLAQVCERMGAIIHYDHQITALNTDRKTGRIEGIEICGPSGYRSLRGRDVIVSLGSWSAPFLGPFARRLRTSPV